MTVVHEIERENAIGERIADENGAGGNPVEEHTDTRGDRRAVGLGALGRDVRQRCKRPR
jgi:hypothetical protein